MYKNVLLGGIILGCVGVGIMSFHAGTVWKLGKVIKYLDDPCLTKKLLFG